MVINGKFVDDKIVKSLLRVCHTAEVSPSRLLCESRLDRLLRVLKAYRDGMSLVAAKVRSRAAGRTCGGCAHYRDGWCAERLSIVGRFSPLQVLSASTAACSLFVAARL